MQNDNVKHPKHYVRNGLECIDAIKAAVSGMTDPFEAYCTGNIIKYIWRWNEKNGIEDLNKAAQYIEFIKSHTAPPIEPNEDKPEGKYEGLSNEELSETICTGMECNNCPIPGRTNKRSNLPCYVWIAQHPAEARALMLDWLNKEGKE